MATIVHRHLQHTFFSQHHLKFDLRDVKVNW
jgi:hypothetical protein